MSAADYKDILAKHGVDPRKMGCVMLDVKPLPLEEFFTEAELDEYEYVSRDPDLRWVSGFYRGEQHVTLKYGLLKNANEIKSDVDKLLEGIQFRELYIDSITSFGQTQEDEKPFECVVGLVKTDAADKNIFTANERLSYLPHIDTFAEYKPHVTIGYIKKEYVQKVINRLNRGPSSVRGYDLEPIGLNYGYKPGEK